MRLIRLPEVLDRTALKKTSVYKLITEGDFPPPVKVGAMSAWVEQEVIDWIADRAAARQSTSSTFASS